VPVRRADKTLATLESFLPMWNNHKQISLPGKNGRQMANSGGRSMQYYQNGGRQIVRKVLEQAAKRLHAPGGSTNGNDIE
jgi:hypothetical protein